MPRYLYTATFKSNRTGELADIIADATDVSVSTRRLAPPLATFDTTYRTVDVLPYGALVNLAIQAKGAEGEHRIDVNLESAVALRIAAALTDAAEYMDWKASLP